MESYSIIDLEGFAKSMREGAASSFEKDYTENLDLTKKVIILSTNRFLMMYSMILEIGFMELV
jgi:hypothetical protein